MNNFFIHLNKLIKHNFIVFIVTVIATFSIQAEENQQGYITDDLTIFMHAGPGTNYRILGSINAGSQIQTTGEASNEYSEIIDDKKRIAWVETKYITRQPGLQFVVEDLNKKLTSGNDYSSQLDGELNGLKNSLNLVNQEKDDLQTEFTKIQKELQRVQSKLKDQDTEIKKQWFFNGAIVLGIGLVLGLILPRFFARRRSEMDNWG
jgi:SH3 domain protein